MPGRNRRRLPLVNLLKLDHDVIVDPSWIKDHVRVILTVCSWYGLHVNWVKKCLSLHKGFHVMISIDPPVEANLANRLQWIFADDAQRVDMNRARIKSGLREWNKLWTRANRRLETIYDASWSLRKRDRACRGI